MKKTKFLILAMIVFAMSNTAANAENFAKQTIQATLPDYVDIKAEEGTLQKNIDPATGNLTEGFNSIFTINSNTALDLYLKAETITQNGAVPAFFKKGETVYIVLSHTTIKPASQAVDDIKSGNATPERNQNAIAYPVSGIQLAGKYDSEPVFDDSKGQYQFKVDQGTTTATTTISPNVDSTTYSFDDRAGNYEAYIILTDTTT